MKQFTFLILLFCFNLLKAQTYISPIIGYDFTDMKTSEDDLNYYNLEKSEKFEVNSLTFGLRLKHKFNSKASLILQSMYSRKFTRGAIITEDPPNKGIWFNYFQNTLSFNYTYKSFNFGIGGGYNFITNLKIIDAASPLFKQISEQGLRFSLGKSFKNFNIETYFYKGLTSNLDYKNKILLLPINALGFSLAYDIKIFDNIKKKTKANCPKF